MKTGLLSKKLFDAFMIRVALALTLLILTALPILSDSATAPPQLSQITSCVEVPAAVVSASRRRSAIRSDCDPPTAFSRALQQSRTNSRDAIAPICLDQISAAEAEEICRAASGSLPTTTGTVPTASPYPRAGGFKIHAQMSIAQQNPKLCVVLRDLPDETETTTQPAGAQNGFCVFNDNQVTISTVRTRARCGVQCVDVRQHPMKVRRFTTAVLSSAEADRILADASAVMKIDDGAGDVRCEATLSRFQGVTAFTETDGTIDTPTEAGEAIRVPGTVKVVNAINFSNETEAMVPNVLGFAIEGGSLVIARADENLEGIAWAHEYGHVRGLVHRDAPGALMNTTADITRRSVNSTECQAFRLDIPRIAFSSMAPILEAGNAAPASHFQNVGLFQDRPRVPETWTDIKKFVRQMFIHGVPYDEATKYSANVVPTLLEMLDDRTEERHWPNIVVVLGMIGDEQALSPMIAFIERDRGKISAAHYRAKTALIMSLGYMINKANSRKALDYVKKGLDPAVWSARVGTNLAPYQSTSVERNEDFARYAVLALALSGHAESGMTLRSLQLVSPDRRQQSFRVRMKTLVADALNEHQRVAAHGLDVYNRRR